MELDFDKEIDAILRNAQRDGPVLVGDAAATRHLDADDIAAFAENALPEKSRALYTRHLADCDRCRKVLSNQLMMSGDAAPIAVAAAAASSTITIERDLPWYRKFLMFPNLAYVMGGLVLVFGGFLAFSVIQNSRMDTGGMISQAPEAENRQGGPNATSEAAVPMANAAANMAVATSEVALDTNSNASSASRPAEPGVAGPRAADNFVADGTDSTAAPPPPPPASAAAGQAVEKDREDKAKEDRAVVGNAPVQESKNEVLLSQQKGMNTQTQSGPSRNSDNQYRAQLENMDHRAAAKQRAARDEKSSGRRVVGGRTFERKQDVWYDIAYQSRPTINVRRGTEEFNRLDAGLRSIANSLSGTIVVVWGAKAYRIN